MYCFCTLYGSEECQNCFNQEIMSNMENYWRGISTAGGMFSYAFNPYTWYGTPQVKSLIKFNGKSYELYFKFNSNDAMSINNIMSEILIYGSHSDIETMVLSFNYTTHKTKNKALNFLFKWAKQFKDNIKNQEPKVAIDNNIDVEAALNSDYTIYAGVAGIREFEEAIRTFYEQHSELIR